MRGFDRFVTVVALAASSSLTLSSQTPDATAVLAAAREALGGEKKLAAVKTFIANGRTRQVRGNNLVPIEFEMNCELPDKFVRKDDFPAQDTDPTTVGFNGDTLIQFPLQPGRGGAPGRGGPPPGGREGAAPPPGREGGSPPSNAGRAGGPPGPNAGRGGAPVPRIVGVKQDFARLMLGLFASSFPSYPLTFKYAAVGEAPEGKADILEVAGPANFQARFVVQQATHLPVMLMWQAPAPQQPTPVEHRMYYADFRDVDGLKLPFRIRRAVAGETVEETTFDRFRINAKIDPRKFEAPK